MKILTILIIPILAAICLIQAAICPILAAICGSAKDGSAQFRAIHKVVKAIRAQALSSASGITFKLSLI